MQTSETVKKRTEIGWPWLIIALVGYVFYALFNRQVFPAASINYALTSDQAATVSRQMAQQLGYTVDRKTIETTVFMNDDDAKTVLEFKLGIKKANELMRDAVPVWLWRTRFCRELTKEQLYLAWTTSGQLKSVYHFFENDLKLPSLSKEEAQRQAELFVTKIAKQDLTGYELFDYGTEPKPNRTDQHFEWKKGGYPESDLRIRVNIAGNKLTEYRYYLAPSDTWTREYKKIRENNELLGKIASFFIFVFIVATIGAFVHGLSSHNVRWRFTLTCSAIVVLLFALDQANNWVNTVDTSYDTSLTFANFVAKQGLTTLLLVVGVLLMSMTLVGGAEIIYRRSWPKHMAMPYLLTRKGMAHSDFLQKTTYGYLIVGGMMLWVISYYMVGERLNFFCPLGVDDYKSIGTLCPAISGALIGVSAAGLEEFACRVVALGLLKKWLKNFWIANFIQAIVWGFAHSQYPQMPSYARGVELTVVGLVFGWIINRYGILPCFVAHYLYDAFLTVEPVFPTHRLYLTIPAMAVLLPFIAGALMSRRWARKHNIEESDLSNAASQIEVAPKENREVEIDRSQTTYEALSKTTRIALSIIGVLCFALTFIPTPDAHEPIGADKKVTISRIQALSLAKKYLKEDTPADDSYLSEIELISKPDDSDKQKWQHIFEQVGKEKTRDIYNVTEPCLEWRAKFFKPQDAKLYWVFMNADGRKRATICENTDDNVGERLTEDAALAKVDAYLKKYRPELLPYEVIGKNKIVHPKRTDYEFELAVRSLDAASTKAQLKAAVKGDQISELRVDWDVPDSWSWPRTTQKWYQQVNNVLRAIGIIALLVASLSWGIYVLRAASMRWKGPLILAGTGFLMSVIGAFNNAAKLFYNYNTAESLSSFTAQSFAQEALKVLIFTFGYLLLSLAGFATIRISFPLLANQLRHGFLLKPHDVRERQMRSNIWLDALIGSYSLIGVLLACRFVMSIANENFSRAVRLDIPRFIPAIFSTSVPSLDIITAIIGGIIFALMAMSIAGGLWKRFLTAKWKSLLLLIFIAILVGASSWYWQDCVLDSCSAFVCLLVIVGFVTRVFRMNLLSYVFVVTEIVSGVRLSELLEHAPQTGQVEIAIMALLLALPLVATCAVLLADKKAVSKNV